MVGEPFNKRSVPCAFGIKIGLYFHEKLDCIGLFSFYIINLIARPDE